MNRLLSANLIRLKKDKTFWIGIVFMAAAGIFIPVMRYLDMRRSGYILHLDNGFFSCAILIGIVMAVFCSLFIGTEYSDGTIRNKVIVGHKRTSIYLANLITCAIAGVTICGVFFLVYFCVGAPLFGLFVMDAQALFLLLLAVVTLSIAFAAIFLLIAALCQNKAVSAVLCILLAFLLLFVGAQLNRMLSEPETNMGLSMTDQGQVYEEIPNPNYLDVEARKVVQFFYDLTPGGQALQCTSGEAPNLPLLPVYSLAIILLTTGVGVFFFQRKELR